MKTTFKAKIIFESDKFHDFDCIDQNLPEINFVGIQKAINEGNITIEYIGDPLTRNCEPTIIIKQK